MTTAGQNPEVLFLFRMRDEISPGMQRISGQTRSVQTQTDQASRAFGNMSRSGSSLGASLASTATSIAGISQQSQGMQVDAQQNAQAFDDMARSGSALDGSLASVGSSMQNIGQQSQVIQREARPASVALQGMASSGIAVGASLVAAGAVIQTTANSFGFLSEETAKSVATFVTIGGAVLSFASAGASLIPVIRALAASQAVLAVVNAAATLNPIAVAGVTGAIIGGIALGALVAKSVGNFQTVEGQVKTVPGMPSQGQLAVVHGGEEIGRPSRGVPMALTVNINAGAFTGTESDARKFARRISNLIREENRLRGTSF